MFDSNLTIPEEAMTLGREDDERIWGPLIQAQRDADAGVPRARPGATEVQVLTTTRLLSRLIRH